MVVLVVIVLMFLVLILICKLTLIVVNVFVMNIKPLVPMVKHVIMILVNVEPLIIVCMPLADMVNIEIRMARVNVLVFNADILNNSMKRAVSVNVPTIVTNA